MPKNSIIKIDNLSGSGWNANIYKDYIIKPAGKNKIIYIGDIEVFIERSDGFGLGLGYGRGRITVPVKSASEDIVLTVKNNLEETKKFFKDSLNLDYDTETAILEVKYK